MLNANNLTTVTDISEESQKSSNNNTFTIDDIIDTAVQDELVQDELRQLNSPGSQSGSPPSDRRSLGLEHL